MGMLCPPSVLAFATSITHCTQASSGSWPVAQRRGREEPARSSHIPHRTPRLWVCCPAPPASLPTTLPAVPLAAGPGYSLKVVDSSLVGHSTLPHNACCHCACLSPALLCLACRQARGTKLLTTAWWSTVLQQTTCGSALTQRWTTPPRAPLLRLLWGSRWPWGGQGPARQARGLRAASGL